MDERPPSPPIGRGNLYDHLPPTPRYSFQSQQVEDDTTNSPPMPATPPPPPYPSPVSTITTSASSIQAELLTELKDSIISDTELIIQKLTEGKSLTRNNKLQIIQIINNIQIHTRLLAYYRTGWEPAFTSPTAPN